MFRAVFSEGDAAYYLHLCELGYRKGEEAVAFYPLLPMLIRGTSSVFGGNYQVTGLVLSNAFSLVGWVLFYERVRRRWGKDVASWALIFLVMFPGSFFFQLLYTESLFFLLVMVLWWGLEERRRGLVWGAALLLPMTRAVGVFAVLPIAWYAVQESELSRRIVEALTKYWNWLGILRAKAERGVNSVAGRGKGLEERLATLRQGDGGNSEVKSQPSGVRNQKYEGEEGMSDSRQAYSLGPCARTNVRGTWGLLTAPLLGWGAYLALMAHWTGNPFDGFAAQRHWGVHSVGNLVNLPKFVLGFFTPTHLHEFTGSLLDRCVFVGVLYTLPVLWRLDKGLLVWTYWLGILPAMSGTFTSYTRFASCAFPVFLGLATFSLNANKPSEGLGAAEARRLHAGSFRFWLKWSLLAGFTTLHLVLVWRHINHRWAG